MVEKRKLTVYVTKYKIDLVKEQGYNLSNLVEDILTSILDIDGYDEAKIKTKVNEINEKITGLNTKKLTYLRQLEETKSKKQNNKIKLKKTKAFNDTVKEMKKTGDIKLENLEKNAAIIGISPDELFQRARKRIEW